MRLWFVTILAMLAIPAQPAPVVADDGTFAACLTQKGSFRGGARGLERDRRCRFNFEIAHDPSHISPADHVVIRTDEILISALCSESVELRGFYEEPVFISRQIRAAQPRGESFSNAREEREPGGEDFLSPSSSLLWFEADFMLSEEPRYILSLKLFGFVSGDAMCQFSGEGRIIELPELEMVE